MVKRKELLYYSLFLLFAALYFFINAPFTFFGIPEQIVWDSRWYDYINTPLVILENFFYLLFLKTFFSDISGNHLLKRTFKLALWLAPGLLTLFIVLTALQQDKQFIFYTVKLLSVIPCMVAVIILLRVKPPFVKWVANGLLCTITGTCITVAMIILRNAGVHHLFTDGYPLFFIRLGILGDMIFYLIAILKKWHFQERQLALEKLQSHLVAEKLRNKISGELHDDLGSTLSGISMYSHMLKDLLQPGEHGKAEQLIAVIQKSAYQATQNLDDLVWSINPLNDSLPMLAERLTEYGKELCYPGNILFTSNFKPDSLTDRLDMKERREVYLIIKEAVNNAVKYSRATEIELCIEEHTDRLEFTLTDNGQGFSITDERNGNGLRNMQNRAEEIGALFTLHSTPGKGTILQCVVKSPNGG